MLPALGQISSGSWGLASHLCAFWLVLHRPPERLLPKFILLLGRQENRVLSSQNSCSGFRSHSCGFLALKSTRGFPGVPESKPPGPPAQPSTHESSGTLAFVSSFPSLGFAPARPRVWNAISQIFRWPVHSHVLVLIQCPLSSPAECIAEFPVRKAPMMLSPHPCIALASTHGSLAYYGL